jgi:hypothetical protein
MRKAYKILIGDNEGKILGRPSSRCEAFLQKSNVGRPEYEANSEALSHDVWLTL